MEKNFNDPGFEEVFKNSDSKRERAFNVLQNRISQVNDVFENFFSYANFIEYEKHKHGKFLLGLIKQLAKKIDNNPLYSTIIVPESHLYHALGNLNGGLGVFDKYEDQRMPTDNLINYLDANMDKMVNYLNLLLDEEDVLITEVSSVEGHPSANLIYYPQKKAA
jgi:hypothetical protein